MIKPAANQVILVLVLALAGCRGLKNITPADPLYAGAEVKYLDHGIKAKKLTSTFKDELKPVPNNRFLWMRPALARYNMLSDSAKTKKFWKNKIKGPVLLSQANPSKIAVTIQDRLFHNGYFNNTVKFDTVHAGKRKAKYLYTITLNDPYRIESVKFPKPQSDLTQKINDSQSQSLLRKGEVYTLDAVKNERARIDQYLKEKGYIYFSPEFILLKADSVTGDYKINAEVTVKPETPPESKIPYTIRNVFINDDNMYEGKAADTLAFGNYYLVSQYNALNFNVLQQGIFLKPGQLYSRSDYMHTIRYLNELSIIRTANIKFLPHQATDELDVMLYLSQRKRFAYSAEFNTVFRSTNYFGPGVIFSFTDKNANKNSEMLKVNLHGSFEMQIVDGDINPAYQVGAEVSYLIRGFYPKFFFNSAKKSLPKTNISAGYNLFNRLDLYRLNSIYTNYGYRWSRTERINHSLNPVEIIFTQLPEESKSQEFNDYLEENPGVQRSFDEQFILGAGYEFTYDPSKNSQSSFFFRGGIDVAGNLLNGLYTAADAPKDSMGRYKLLGVSFSQYMRTRADISYGFIFNPRSKLIVRFSAGVGVPLGNSDILPYVKQFYVGGTNSLRSFIARSVGPGSEVPPEGYNDLTGDIRMEGNLEYRFEISGRLKGALFMDAGNIWLFNKDDSRPKGNFHFDSFLQDIAISSGWGLRWDFDFIVARLDFAYTLRTPYLPAGEKWASSFEFWNPTINIAIGYPF